MKLKKFKEKDNKRIGIIGFTIVCILLVSGVILYRTFAVFEVKTNQNVINGTIQDPGNLYFAFYQKNEENGEYEIKKEMPNLSDGYVLDEIQSYCGVGGEKDTDIEVYLSEDGYIKVKGMRTSRTKCNLYFAKGIFITGKGIPVVESGDGLYVVEHPASETEGMEEGWQTDEYRFAGVNPNNYVWFNEELWRIIGLVNVKVDKGDEQTAIEQRLKIIRNSPLDGNYSWDSSPSSVNGGYGVNEWSQADLKTLLNNYYYNSLVEQDCYVNSNNTLYKCSFDKMGLKNEVKTMIDKNIIWNTGTNGGSFSFNNIPVKPFYNLERSQYRSVCTNPPYCTDKVERTVEWSKTSDPSGYQGIGLVYPSDYGYATSGGENTTRDTCLEKEMSSWNNYNDCFEKNWFHKNLPIIWTLSPCAMGNYAYTSYAIYSDGKVDKADNHKNSSVFPVIYLSTDIRIISGTGTSDDAFLLNKI